MPYDINTVDRLTKATITYGDLLVYCLHEYVDRNQSEFTNPVSDAKSAITSNTAKEFCNKLFVNGELAVDCILTHQYLYHSEEDAKNVLTSTVSWSYTLEERLYKDGIASFPIDDFMDVLRGFVPTWDVLWEE